MKLQYYHITQYKNRNDYSSNIKLLERKYEEIEKEVIIDILEKDKRFIKRNNTEWGNKKFLLNILDREYLDKTSLDDIINSSKNIYFVNYYPNNLYNSSLSIDNVIECHIWGTENYKDLKAFYDLATSIKKFLLGNGYLVTEPYLEALRIKEENRGIKLTKEQSYVLETIDDQCRWWSIPTDDVDGVLKILGIQPNINEGDITSIIDDVQRENKVAIATFTDHTIIFGMNAPYISYPDLKTYLAKEEQQTAHLQEALNKLSKAFGTAAYFEYNNDDEQIASLAWSSKGKFVYGRFTSEGEGYDVFGTQKKTMEVNQKSIIKTAKKLGTTPADILTGIMKQKMPIQYFEQPHWYIESRSIQ